MISILSVNIGTDLPLPDALHLNSKTSTVNMVKAYSDMIKSHPVDIINLQEVLRRTDCEESNINCYRTSYYPDNICGDKEDQREDVIGSACCMDSFFNGCHGLNDNYGNDVKTIAELIIPNEYKVICNPYEQDYECMAFRKERFTAISNMITIHAESSCDRRASVNYIRLRENTTKREFWVGNAHPELINRSCNKTLIKRLFEAIGPSNCMNDSECNDGIPANVIISGDFNREFQNYGFYEIAYGGYKQVFGTSYKLIFGGNIDHVFSNMIKSQNCYSIPSGVAALEPHSAHNAILCYMNEYY